MGLLANWVKQWRWV